MTSGFIFTFWILHVVISVKPTNTKQTFREDSSIWCLEKSLKFTQYFAAHHSILHLRSNALQGCKKPYSALISDLLLSRKCFLMVFSHPEWKVYLLETLKCREKEGKSLSSSHTHTIIYSFCFLKDVNRKKSPIMGRSRFYWKDIRRMKRILRGSKVTWKATLKKNRY